MHRNWALTFELEIIAKNTAKLATSRMRDQITFIVLSISLYSPSAQSYDRGNTYVASGRANSAGRRATKLRRAANTKAERPIIRSFRQRSRACPKSAHAIGTSSYA
jgi:hypothetical protein